MSWFKQARRKLAMGFFGSTPFYDGTGSGRRALAWQVGNPGAVAIGVTLWAWGQPLICTCGYVRFWVGSIFSSGNSQHIADWYTLSHVVHGLLIVLVGRALLPRIDLRVLLAVAIVTGVAWEIVEHTDMVLDRFRATTLYQG